MKKRIFQTAFRVIGVLLLAISASAETNSISRGIQRLGQTAKAGDIIGASVQSDTNEKLGTLDDLAVDIENGRVVEAILAEGGRVPIGTGGDMMSGAPPALGQTYHAVPPSILQFDSSDKVARLNASKAKLESGPKFEMIRWRAPWKSNDVAAVYAYYGERLYLASAQELPSSRFGRDTSMNRSTAMKTPQLCYVQQASKVIGATVRNLQDQKLGDVNNLVVDLAAGRIVAVVIASGGFLGLGEELSAVPPAALHLSADRKGYLLDISKETLAAAPHFKSDQWPDFNQPNYSFGIYTAYKVEPYFQSSPFGADNSAQNFRDRNGATLTPFDQGNGASDLNLTAKIRKELMSRNDLSINARNVKIITVNGRVTLRGPVNSLGEKNIVEDIAAKVAGKEKVDNELKFNTQ